MEDSTNAPAFPVRTPSSTFQGRTTAEQVAYARDEVHDALIQDTDNPLDASASFYNVDMQREHVEDDSDPGYLFSILEDALAQKREQQEHTWERVRRWLWKYEAPQRLAAAYVRGTGDVVPLHLLCKLPNAPDDIVIALVEAAPDTVSWNDAHGWLPLHHACAVGASPEVIHILVDTYPAGKKHQDNQGRTPLHFYATRNSDPILFMIANATMLSDSGAAELADRGGMLPMHYACAYGTQPAVLKVLAEAYPESLVAKESHGRTPMHLAMVNAHRNASPNTIQFLLSYPESKATINTRDQDGYLPLHLLALALKGYRADDHEKRAHVSDSLTMYLAAEPIATPDFLTAIQDFPDWLQDIAVVSKHVRNVLNEKIVKRFPTSILMLDGYLLIVLIVCFAMTTANHINLRFAPETTQNTTQGALVVVFICAIYFFFRVLIQVFSIMSLGNFGNWRKDHSNWLDVSVIILVFYYAILMADGDFSAISNNAFRSGVAFTQGLLWVAIILFLKKTMVDFAVFVGGVFYVVQRLVAFLLAVGVILLTFAQMFYFVYVDTDMCSGEGLCRFPHCTFGESLLKVYTMMMGEIGDETRYSTNLTAQILFVFYGVLVVILLSNVLIAITQDSYEIIQNDRAAIVFWNNRLDFCAEIDSIAYAVQRRIKCFGNEKRIPSAEVQEGPTEEFPQENGYESATDYFYEGWHQVMLLFDNSLYEEIDWFESWIYNCFRVLCIFIIIPLWLTAGIVTAGWLWPPQVREYLFVQRETAISRAEIERQKLKQLQGIHNDLKCVKNEIMREMDADRDEMARMRTEIEAVQSEVILDLQQVKDLMASLLGG